MGYLYITESDAQIGVAESYVTVKHKDGSLTKIPVETLEAVSIFGRSQITTQCIQECLKRGVPVSYYSKGGTYFGRIHSTGHINVARQRKQACLLGSELALKLSKKIIKSKMHNQYVVLQRYGKSRGVDVSQTCTRMKILMEKVPDCTSVEQIMGYEGNAAKLYFQTLNLLVEPAFSFNGRSRRPPMDAFNSMLSLGYSVLMNEFYGKIENKGLHPYFGFMHQDREKHPTLASDLMEEWRAVIVDSLVMSLVNGHEILEEHFYQEEERPGVFLTKARMSIFIKKLEDKMRKDIHYLDYIDYSVSFRRAMELQVASFSKVIEEEDAEMYHPIWIR